MRRRVRESSDVPEHLQVFRAADWPPTSWPEVHAPGCPWGAFRAWQAARDAFTEAHPQSVPSEGPLGVGDEPIECYRLQGVQPW